MLIEMWCKCNDIGLLSVQPASLMLMIQIPLKLVLLDACGQWGLEFGLEVKWHAWKLLRSSHCIQQLELHGTNCGC
jgi:hypothetical protein